MFDIGADELLLTAVVAIVVIGPKDMPRALRTAGRWVAKLRRMSSALTDPNMVTCTGAAVSSSPAVGKPS